METNYESFYGTILTKEPCALCQKHGKFMTARQIKTRECLKKQCRHLDKNEHHSYWKEREAIKAKRKARKEDKIA